MPKPGNQIILGRVRRLADDLPEFDPRSDFANNPSNLSKLKALVREFDAKGKPVNQLSQKDLRDYALQFEKVASDLLTAFQAANLLTPQQIYTRNNPPHPQAPTGSQYFVLEWRIKTQNRDPVNGGGACGCGCGCGCGG